ncbi:MAG: hypothetical protein ACKO6G_02970 [Vulcanococcus sp.]
MKPKLCAAGKEMRNAFDTWFPSRRTASDGWLGDSRHAARKSDHNPDKFGWVRAVDIDSRLCASEGISADLADQIRIAGKTDKRISYVIHNGKIASKVLGWRWRKYNGINPHIKHLHCSFTKLGDLDGKPFDIPLLGGKI